jgi:DNA-binding NarL/FixJ family response regulator
VAGTLPLKVAIFDDDVAARREVFHVPGLVVEVHPHADDANVVCGRGGHDVVCMDFAMGAAHKDGARATRDLRANGYRGRIVAMSSDPAANAAMCKVGADEALAKKAHLRSYLVRLGATHLASRG